jgi:Ca-activated chloride channel family protein
MIFATPSALWLLPVVLALVWYRVRFGRRADPALGYSFLADLRGLESPAALFWLRVRPWLRGGALVLLVLALARPQQGLRNDERDIQATDIMICLDVSYSMRAEDFAPKNRIEIAKEAAARFIAKRDQSARCRPTGPLSGTGWPPAWNGSRTRRRNRRSSSS